MQRKTYEQVPVWPEEEENPKNLENIDESEFTTGTSEPELKQEKFLSQEESVENLKFLVDHFRNLAQAKDAVIRIYRDQLDEVRRSHGMKEYRWDVLRRELEDRILSLLPKKKKK